MNEEIEKAAISLENWLSDPHELGHKPSKIKYLNKFKDEDVINCMIFKYKDNLLTDWYLGIVSDSGIFSEMKEYKKEKDMENGELKKGSRVLIRENVAYTSSEMMREIIKEAHICALCNFRDLYNRIKNGGKFIINPGSHDYGFKGTKELLKDVLQSK